MDVYGVGVLILGKSGIGKSECALDCDSRGHRPWWRTNGSYPEAISIFCDSEWFRGHPAPHGDRGWDH